MGYNFIMMIDTTDGNYEGNFEQNVSSNFTEVIVDDTTTYTAQQWSFLILNQVFKEYKVEYVFSESNAPTSIDDGAFAQSHLLSITIPSSVTSIGDGAFYMCQEMTSIYFERTTPPTVGEWTFYLQSSDGCTFYVPTGTISTYANTQYYPSNTSSYQEWNPTVMPTTLNGALELLGETLASNITSKGVSASASDGLTTLANKVLQISGDTPTPTVIFEDKGVTGDYNSDYTDLQSGITTTVGTTGTKVQASGWGDKFRKANALISGDFEAKYTCIEATVVYGSMRFMDSSNNNIFTVEQFGNNDNVVDINTGSTSSYPIGETITFPFTMTIQRENGKLSVWYNDIQVASNITVSNADGYFSWKLYGNDGRYQIFKDLLITDLSTPYNPCSEYQTQISDAITYINGSGT